MAIALEQFANSASTTLSSAYVAGGATLPVASVAGFPTTGQFRVRVDDEIMVAQVSGSTLAVTPGSEGTTPANHNSGATVKLVVTADVVARLYRHNYGERNYLASAPAAINSFADQTAAIQQFLLDTPTYVQNFKATHGVDDQVLRHVADAVFPYNVNYNINDPIVVPEFVNLDIKGCFGRDGRGGTAASSYDGTVGGKALANLYQPAVILPMNAHCIKAEIYCNPDGVNVGSGMFVGKSWVTSAVTLVGGGSGYAVSQVVTLPQPSKPPYLAPKISITSVDGNGAITGFTVTQLGAYALPAAMQRSQWTAANGYSGAMAAGTIGQVFDGSGNYVSTGGTGTGATFSQQWKPDFDGVNPYYGGAQLIGNTSLGRINIIAAGKSTDIANGDPTYGYKFAFAAGGLNHRVDEVIANGGDIGVWLKDCTDFAANQLNPVGAGRNLVVSGGGSIECPNVVLDTADVTFFDLDKCGSIKMRSIQCLTNKASPVMSSGYAARIGFYSSSSWYNVALDINVSLPNCGTAAGITGMYLAYTKASRVNVDASNYAFKGVNPGTKLIGKLFEFGPGVDASNVITGSIDWGGLQPPSTGGSNPSTIPSATPNPNGTILPIYAGTMPSCQVQIWNADVVGTGVGGMLDNTGNYTISGTTPPTAGNWPQNTLMRNTAPSGGNPRGWYCSVAGTNGNGGTWVAL